MNDIESVSSDRVRFEGTLSKRSGMNVIDRKCNADLAQHPKELFGLGSEQNPVVLARDRLFVDENQRLKEEVESLRELSSRLGARMRKGL